MMARPPQLKYGKGKPASTSKKLSRNNKAQSANKERERPVQVSGFFKLPRELRDIIYEEVLTTDRPLYFRRFHRRGGIYVFEGRAKSWIGVFGKLPQIEGISEFNRLKYVSALLYDETAWLELRYNAIDFRGGSGRMFWDMSEFLRLESKIPLWTQYLTSVSIHTQLGWEDLSKIDRNPEFLQKFFKKDHLREILRLLDFCRNHPTIEVRWMISEFRTQLCHHTYIAIGLALWKLFRAEVATSELEALERLRLHHYYRMLPDRAWFSRLRECFVGEKGVPSNFKIMPGYGSSFEEVRSKLSRGGWSGWTSAWENNIRDWHQSGIQIT